MLILVATDFSTRSQRAVRRAGVLARETSAELVLLHVIEHGLSASPQLEAREAHRMIAEQIAAVSELAGVRCRGIVAIGDASDAILNGAKSESVDLIVIGASRKRRLSFGKRTDVRLLRNGSYPVLIVGQEAKAPYTAALAPVDLTGASARALNVAKALKVTEKGHVKIVHAFVALAKGKMAIASIGKDSIEQYVRTMHQEAAHKLAEFLAVIRVPKHGWSGHVDEGSALDVIDRAVDAMSPDLLVMGTHGRSVFGRALLGSVTEEVLRSIDIDILAIPPLRAGLLPAQPPRQLSAMGASAFREAA